MATASMSISLFRSIAHQYQNLRQINSVSMMNVISHQIEDQILYNHLPVDLYAGFQKFSNFPDQLRRYSRLGAICRRIYVFGIADYQPESIPGIEFIELAPTDALTQEWFLLIDTPNFWTVLVAQEMQGKDSITGGRRFDGVWSFDEVVVDRISLLISQVMETTYEPVQPRNYSRQNVHIAQIHGRLLGMHEQCELVSQRRWVQLRTLQRGAELICRDLLELLQNAVRILQTVFGAKGTVIAMRIANDQIKVMVAEGDAIGQGWKVPISQGLSGQVLQQRQAVQILDATRRQVGEPLLPSAKTLICVPIVNRRLHGTITVGHSRPNYWNDEDTQTLTAFARMLAVQLEQFLRLKGGQVNSTGIPMTGGPR